MSKKEQHSRLLDQPALKENIFQVPEGYFDSLETKIEGRILAEEGELAQNRRLKKTAFVTPDGYFGALEKKLLEAVDEQPGSLETDVHLRENVFTVPEGFFEKQHERIIQATVSEAEKTKVIPLYQRNWFRFAVAAMLVMGLFFFKSGDPDYSLDLLDELSNEALLDYLQSQNEADLELITSMDGFDLAIDEILVEEASYYDFDASINPELEYDFEFLEQ